MLMCTAAVTKLLLTVDHGLGIDIMPHSLLVLLCLWHCHVL